MNILNDDIISINLSVNTDGKLVFTDSTGADTVIPFSSGKTITVLGEYGADRTIDVSLYYNGDLTKLTSKDNFLLAIHSVYYGTYAAVAGWYTLTPALSYASSTGKLTISGSFQWVNNGTHITVRTIVYLIV